MVSKIVYLLGAGSTQGEMDHQGLSERTLLRDLGVCVYEMSKEKRGKYEKLCTDFGIPPDQDIEIMISLFESGSDDNSHFGEIAGEIRQLYRVCLLERITRQDVSPIIVGNLLYIHRKYGQHMGENGEELLGVLTTNNDSLIDRAFCHEKTYDGLNYGYPFIPKRYYREHANAPLLLKLHGSFSWRVQSGNKLIVSDEYETEEDDDFSGWIPPSVFKKPIETPVFKEIWRKARELLKDCDVLRVVGCSMRNEDIQLLSLLFRSQVYAAASRGQPFQIELIIPEKSAQGGDQEPGIIQRVRYLSRPKSLSELYVFREEFDQQNRNPYYYWVDKMISWIEKKDVKISDDDFILQTLYGGNPL